MSASQTQMERAITEMERNNHLMALLIQVVVETHGNSLKYKEKLDQIMDVKK